MYIRWRSGPVRGMWQENKGNQRNLFNDDVKKKFLNSFTLPSDCPARAVKTSCQHIFSKLGKTSSFPQAPHLAHPFLPNGVLNPKGSFTEAYIGMEEGSWTEKQCSWQKVTGVVHFPAIVSTVLMTNLWQKIYKENTQQWKPCLDFYQ